MRKVDLNCDLGESFGNYTIGNDYKVIPLITSANVACGFHAGDPMVIQKTVHLAKENEVSVGAHPGFPDLQGFGRRNLDMTHDDIYSMLIYQIGAVRAFCNLHDVPLNHVKPHGALYQMGAKDRAIARVIAQAVFDIDPNLIFVGLSQSYLIEEAQKVGLQTASEVFADRRYEANGQLVSRKHNHAVIEDTEEAISQVVKMVTQGTVTATNGEDIHIKADTICVHGDGAHALEFVKQIRDALSKVGVNIVKLGG
ncbi:5-oxoprolinase subunit PxpA [Staphylococcus hyicus]|uniref:5-oxoprolinase subunit PxpA n=2 Tax=Staphylococcus hyicus TaxID=1284 RepID=A0ACD5FNN3_STAHY|nr:5-oxoprolinase subunit PxpA [Staphylococcus hyicus]MCQ9290939.1 5-oxoprolinase subunit PxpA [Staphylococcus hyicus]MCQ9299786.1 5-oxoprolinase subunit PxpA [Staphylococcus hyicus]MCQ9306180.1 5-oxoprolinase subunit PxpA [Staphylococcus hyicus]MCQ9308593.1 5-oxoprolinase subunit PxpA [Staphylococcus hyicus]MCQ9311014.1 5-oxoprolinase subunit PxpA [Staphylococcus hyicus]